jgi:hypothetical protein
MRRLRGSCEKALAASSLHDGGREPLIIARTRPERCQLVVSFKSDGESRETETPTTVRWRGPLPSPRSPNATRCNGRVIPVHTRRWRPGRSRSSHSSCPRGFKSWGAYCSDPHQPKCHPVGSAIAPHRHSVPHSCGRASLVRGLVGKAARPFRRKADTSG